MCKNPKNLENKQKWNVIVGFTSKYNGDFNFFYSEYRITLDKTK